MKISGWINGKRTVGRMPKVRQLKMWIYGKKQPIFLENMTCHFYLKTVGIHLKSGYWVKSGAFWKGLKGLEEGL